MKKTESTRVNQREKLSQEFLSREDLKFNQGVVQSEKVYKGSQRGGANLIDLSDLTPGKQDFQKIKTKYFERYSKTNASQNVF